MSHFYTPSGEPAHEGGLKTARQNGYFPSVTTITHIVANEGIVRYRIRQMMEAALTLPRLPNESDDAFIARLTADSIEHSEQAKELGTLIHDVFSTYFITGEWKGHHIPPLQRPSVMMALQYIQERQFRGLSEVSFAFNGYGGQIDFFGVDIDGEKYILDIKTQEAKQKNKNGTPQFSPHKEWALQLAAYRLAVANHPDYKDYAGAQCVNLIISTNPDIPGYKARPWPEYHTTNFNLTRALAQFDIQKQLYYVMNNLDPTFATRQTSFHNSKLLTPN